MRPEMRGLIKQAVFAIHENVEQDLKLNHYAFHCLKIELKDKNRHFGILPKKCNTSDKVDRS